MPELPEVETIARTLKPLVVGKRIEAVHVLHPGSVDGSLELSGMIGGKITDVRRRGKLVLVDVQGGKGLCGFAVHLKMTGKLFVYPEGTEPGPHTRVWFALDSDERLFFEDARKFGYVRGLSLEMFADWEFWASLGPEPLEIAATTFAGLLAGHKATIKSLLLNQKRIAGIGNIYADESLFRAGIHPSLKTAWLTGKQLERLHTCLVEVLEESIRDCGSSIKDYRTARGDAGAFQNKFRVYGRGGKPCFICGQILETTSVAGRTTVFCPVCQPR